MFTHSPKKKTGSRHHDTALAQAIAQRQQQVALWMSSWFQRLPLQGRKVCLLCFCLLLGSASGWLLLGGLPPGHAFTGVPFPVAGKLPVSTSQHPAPVTERVSCQIIDYTSILQK